MLKQMVPADE